MLIILLDIFISVRLRKRAVAQPTQVWQNDANNGQRQKNLHKQMFILMFASICIFFITNLPFAIGKIVLPRDSQVVTSAARLTTIWTILGWFQSLNYAVRECVIRWSSIFVNFIGQLLHALPQLDSVSQRIQTANKSLDSCPANASQCDRNIQSRATCSSNPDQIETLTVTHSAGFLRSPKDGSDHGCCIPDPSSLSRHRLNKSMFWLNLLL